MMNNDNDELMKNEKEIYLCTSDGYKIKTKRKYIIAHCGLIRDMLEEQDDEDDDDDEVIPLPNINDQDILKKIIDYCKFHYNNKAEEIEKPLKENIENVICDWDKTYLKNINNETLINIIMASNYINCKDLLNLTCAKVASTLKGKSPEQIRELFGIENDFTPEEESKIREENKWCEEC